MEENPIQTIPSQQSSDLPIDKQTLANNLTEIKQKLTNKAKNAKQNDLKGENVYDDQEQQKPIRRESKVKALDCIEQLQTKEKANIQIKIANPIMKHKKTLSSSKKLQIQESKNITLNQVESAGQRLKQKDKQQEQTRKGKIVKNVISDSQYSNKKWQKVEQKNIAPYNLPQQSNARDIEHKEQHEANKNGINCSNMSTPLSRSYKSIKQNEEQFDKLSRKSRQTFRSSHSSCEDYLSHVFDFYCKISYAVGKDPTFDQINSKMQIMTITNFMIFCKDFQLRECFERERLVEIFKRHSDCQKYMNSSHFHSAIQSLSELLYSNCEQSRRFGKMLVYLKIHNSHSFVKKMNDLGVSFRMKNKRGIQVNLTPKYNFKLTMNNGRTLQHIQLQVKQRSQIRKLLKQEHIQWHKRNRLNKIDELYKNGAKNIKKDNIANSLSTQTQKNPTNANNDPKSSNSKKLNGYYNPCEMLSLRRQPTYKKINELKKMNSIGSRLRKQQTDRVYDDCKLDQSNKNIVQQCQSQSREMKISSVIKMAKNVILQEKSCNNTAFEEKYSREKAFGSIKKQIIENTIVRNNCYESQKQNNQLKDAKQHGSIKHQIIGDATLLSRQHKLLTSQKLTLSESKYFNEIYPVTNNKTTGIRRRNTKQLKQEEYLIEQQLRNIPQTINESKIKPKDYLRATAKIEQQYQKQLYDLEEMIGVFSDNDDQILVQHFMMERKQELGLNHVRDSVSY